MATGFNYEATTNAFTGVEIPFAYGDGSFDLHLWDQGQGRWADSGHRIATGQYFSFEDRLGQASLTRFSVRGIEGGVDAQDPLAFVTGLTFASDQTGVDFTMTPVIAGDIDGDGDVDLDDLALINAALNSNAYGPDDPRDLDRDGRITALDARKLVTLCTRPRCARR
jgi:hypothetical protein